MTLYVNNKVLFQLQQGSNHFWRLCSPSAQNNKLTLSQLNVINHRLKRGVSQLPLYHSLLLTQTPVLVKCSALLLCIYRVPGSDLRKHKGYRPWGCYDLPQSIQKKIQDNIEFFWNARSCRIVHNSDVSKDRNALSLGTRSTGRVYSVHHTSEYDAYNLGRCQWKFH